MGTPPPGEVYGTRSSRTVPVNSSPKRGTDRPGRPPSPPSIHVVIAPSPPRWCAGAVDDGPCSGDRTRAVDWCGL